MGFQCKAMVRDLDPGIIWYIDPYHKLSDAKYHQQSQQILFTSKGAFANSANT